MAAACYGGLLDDGGNLFHLSRKLLTQLQYPYPFPGKRQRNCGTSHGQSWAPKCADFIEENLHAFYQSCPKPEACLWFSTVESVYFQIIVTGRKSINYCFHLVALFGLHYPQQPFGLARPGQLRKHLNAMVACVEERASLSLFISQQIVCHTQSIDLSMALDIHCGATVGSTTKQNKFIWTGVASCGLASSL